MKMCGGVRTEINNQHKFPLGSVLIYQYFHLAPLEGLQSNKNSKRDNVMKQYGDERDKGVGEVGGMY